MGQWTAKQIADYFATTKEKSAPNYGVGKDGSIALCVDEQDRSWCTSNADNDHRAITIEVASDTKHPYKVTDTALEALKKLLVDICQRNGKTKLIWFGDKAKTLSYTPAQNEMVMTVHRWFANKACPGDYLYNLHGKIAEQVNARLMKEEEEEMTLFKSVKDIPDWAKSAAEKAIKNGYIKKDASGNIGVWEVNLQTLVWMDRAGMLDKPAANV